MTGNYNETMLLRTLGGLELTHTAFTRPKPLLLLAYLALEGPQDRRHLAELFWPEAADHMKSLTVALSQLRQGAPGAIEADHQRCWVALKSDAQAFLSRLDQGELEEALEGYPAPFLRGFHLPELGVELEEWVLKTREYLAGRARQALLALAEREAASGQFAAAGQHAEEAYTLSGAAEPELEELTRLYPLLLAGDSLYAAEVRRELESLGHGIESPQSPEEARSRLSRAGRSALRQSILPTRNTYFVGRRSERAQLKEWLHNPDQRLISLLGPAGVGKTRLALEVAQELQAAEVFAGGVHFVDLEVLEDPQRLSEHITQTLHIEVKPDQEALQALSQAIAQESTLLVLDNYEHLTESALELSSLLRACPNLRIIATTRERLGLEEEQIFPLSGLRYPHDDAVMLEEAERFYAVQLFVDRARRVRPDFELGQADLSAVIRICRLVDGLPLALELAAAWVRVMALGEIADELGRNLDLLESTAKNVPQRHKSIRAAFEYSWKLLPPKEQEVLAKLSVFRGGFRREAASLVTGATIPVLVSLVDKSFLRMTQGGRYHRHPLVYEFTREKLAQTLELRSQTIDQHSAYFLHWLDQVQTDLTGPKHGEILEQMAEELENIRLAWRWAVRQGQWGLLETTLEAITVFFDHRNRCREGLELLQVALAALEASPSPQTVRGELLAKSAWLQYRLGQHEPAEQSAQQAIASLPAESRSALLSLNVLASIAWRRGDYAQARAHWLGALEVVEAQGNTRGIGRFSGNLAIIEQALGNTAAARGYLQRSLEIAQSIGDHVVVAHNFNRLGDLEFSENNLEAAQALWQQGLEHAEQQGIENAIPMLLHNLGRVAAERRDYAQASVLLQQSLERSATGDPYLKSQTLTRLGWVATAQGDYRGAHHYLAQALELAHSLQAIPNFLKATLALAALRLEQGQPQLARPLLLLVAEHPASEQKEREQAKATLQTLPAIGAEQTQPLSLEEVLQNIRGG